MTLIIPPMSARATRSKPDVTQMTFAFIGESVSGDNFVDANGVSFPRSGNSLVFDSAFDRTTYAFSGLGGISVGAVPINASGFTVAAWVKSSAEDTAMRVLTLNPTDSPTIRVELTDAGAIELGVLDAVYSHPVTQTDWNHIVIRGSFSSPNNVAEFFVNGSLVSTLNYTPGNIGSGISYWGASESNSIRMNGQMVDFLVADLLSDSEISWLSLQSNFLG